MKFCEDMKNKSPSNLIGLAVLAVAPFAYYFYREKIYDIEKKYMGLTPREAPKTSINSTNQSERSEESLSSNNAQQNKSNTR